MGSISYLITIIILIAILFLGIVYLLNKFDLIKLGKSEIESDDYSPQKEQEIDKLKKMYQSLLKKNQELEYKLHQLQNKSEVVKLTGSELKEQAKKLNSTKSTLTGLKKQKDQLLQMVHDIKNPASAIGNFVQLLETFELSSEEQNEVMEHLIHTSQRLVKLSVDMSKTIANDMSDFTLELAKHNLNHIAENSYHSHKLSAEKKGITLSLNLDKDMGKILIDAYKVEEAIENLLDNAVKYSPYDTQIKLRTKRTESSAEIIVSDQGPGISTSEMQNIFSKGGFTSNKPTGGEESTGLGLWIVKTIAEAHGGKVKLVSSESKGSKFILSLPYKKADS